MKVLVTDGAMNKSLAVVRAIAPISDSIGVTSRFPISVAGVSKDADARHWIRNRDPRSYVDRLNELTERHGYDYLLPVGGETFETVSEYRDSLDLPVEEILPSRESMNVAVEKRETYELAERVGIPTPTTEAVSSKTELVDVTDTVGFPAVVKTGTETEARFVEIVESMADLEMAYDEYSQRHESEAIIQEYLPGVGRGYFGMFVDGECVGGYTHRRIREYPPEGGASACAESSQDEELREYSTRLLSSLNWTGVVMVEFKESRESVPKIVEINPKFWGSLDLAIESGLNFPRSLLEYVNGRTEFSFEFTPQRVHWPLSGDLTHAWRSPRSAPAVFRDLVSSETRSNVRLDDPFPHVVEAAVTLVRQDL